MGGNHWKLRWQNRIIIGLYLCCRYRAAHPVTGLLWFPFNLIAKSGNYGKAVEAADSRIGKLQSLKQQKNCTEMSDNQKTVAVDEITKKLVELSALHKSGQLDDAEYRAAKRQVLGL